MQGRHVHIAHDDDTLDLNEQANMNLSKPYLYMMQSMSRMVKLSESAWSLVSPGNGCRMQAVTSNLTVIDVGTELANIYLEGNFAVV